MQHTSHHDLGKVTARLREDNERGGGEGGLEVKAFVCVPEVVSLNASLPGSIWCRRVGDYACVEVVKFGLIVYPGRPVSRTERTISTNFHLLGWERGREGGKILQGFSNR